MITSEQLLLEIEQQVRLARQAGGEQARREAVYAVRALCNVMLDSKQEAPLPHQPIQPGSVQPAPVTSLNEKPLQEADANGESLFDF